LEQVNKYRRKIVPVYFFMCKILKVFSQELLQMLFPAYCLGCGQEGGVLCIKCGQDLSWQKIELCPVCRAESLSGKICLKCVDVSLAGALAGSVYEETGLIGKLIKNFKYEYSTEAGRELCKLVSDQVRGMKDFFINFDMLVPVPLHSRRWAERGFNQAEILAMTIAKESGVQISACCLRRIKNTPRQAGLSRTDRVNNLKDAFLCQENVSGRKILLVDDVLTTGTTLIECARILRASGAKEVWGYTVARG